MLSALIPSRRSYPALHLVAKLVHQRSVHPGPLVLGTTTLLRLSPAADRDQPVSRRFEPSSRILLNGEQPYASHLLQRGARMSRHRCRYFSILTDRIGLYLHPFKIKREMTYYENCKALIPLRRYVGEKSLRGYNSMSYTSLTELLSRSSMTLISALMISRILNDNSFYLYSS